MDILEITKDNLLECLSRDLILVQFFNSFLALSVSHTNFLFVMLLFCSKFLTIPTYKW